MAQDNIEIVRTALDAWNRGDWEATLNFMHPDVEWRTSTPILDLPPVSHGHEGVRAFWRTWTASWNEIRADPEEFIPIGDDGVLLLLRWRARSNAGLDVDQQVAWHFTIRDGLLTRFVSYWEPAEAFKALGLPTRG
jgi:uncharacterized protein